MGISKRNISKFKIPNEIKKILSDEYNIRIESLFIEKFIDEEGLITATLRNVIFRYTIIIKDKKLIELKTEVLNNFI